VKKRLKESVSQSKAEHLKYENNDGSHRYHTPNVAALLCAWQG